MDSRDWSGSLPLSFSSEETFVPHGLKTTGERAPLYLLFSSSSLYGFCFCENNKWYSDALEERGYLRLGPGRPADRALHHSPVAFNSIGRRAWPSRGESGRAGRAGPSTALPTGHCRLDHQLLFPLDWCVVGYKFRWLATRTSNSTNWTFINVPNHLLCFYDLFILFGQLLREALVKQRIIDETTRARGRMMLMSRKILSALWLKG